MKSIYFPKVWSCGACLDCSVVAFSAVRSNAMCLSHESKNCQLAKVSFSFHNDFTTQMHDTLRYNYVYQRRIRVTQGLFMNPFSSLEIYLRGDLIHHKKILLYICLALFL